MTLHLDVLGQGPATVVVLHGLPTPPEAMRPLAERLAASRRVLVPHLPGYGRSPIGDPSPHAKAAAVAAAVRRAAPGPVDLVGFSGGFHLACLLALEGLLPVGRLIGLAPSVGVEAAEAPLFHGFAQAARQHADLSEMFAARMHSEGFRAGHPDEARKAGRWIFATTFEHLADELAAFADAGSLRPRLRDLQVPTWLIVGEHDPATPPAVARALADEIPGARLDILPDSGHACFIERPDEVMRLLGAALESPITNLP